jgi:2-oxoglutarate ferredoxin oxidoreductase subunit gamma
VYPIRKRGEEADLEHELFISGIGGQGIQLMGKVLALGAIAENLFVQLTGEYGGAMRGGSTVASVVIGADRLRALPVVSEGGAALLMHDKFVDESVMPKLRPGSLIVAESSIVDLLPDLDGHHVIPFPGKTIALEIGNAQSTGLVMLAAYCAITGLVGVESLVTAMKQVVPSYRRQHVEANEKALRAGFAAAPRRAVPVVFGKAMA